jgi:hypothetical protein
VYVTSDRELVGSEHLRIPSQPAASVRAIWLWRKLHYNWGTLESNQTKSMYVRNRRTWTNRAGASRNHVANQPQCERASTMESSYVKCSMCVLGESPLWSAMWTAMWLAMWILERLKREWCLSSLSSKSGMCPYQRYFAIGTKMARIRTCIRTWSVEQVVTHTR